MKSIFTLLFTIIPLLLFSQESNKDIDLLIEEINENLRNNFENAKPLIDSGFVLCKETNDSLNLLFVTNKLGVYYHIKEEVDSAKKYYTQLINNIENIDSSKKDNDILNLLYNTSGNLGMLYSNNLDIKNARKYYLISEKIAIELKNIEKIIGVKIKRANLFQRENNSTKSINILFECLQTLDTINDVESEIRSLVYSALGANFYRINNFDNAKKYFLKAIKFDEEGNDLNQKIINIENCLHIVWETEGIQNVDSLLEEYIKLSKSSNIPFHVLRSQIILGDYFLEKQELDSALYYFESTLPLIEKKDIGDLYQELYLLGGRIYTELRLDNTAIKMFELSLQYPQSIDQSFLGYESLYELSKKGKDTKRALHYLEKLTTLKDSIEIIDQRKFAQKLELEYDVEEKELRNNFLVKELDTEQKLKANEKRKKHIFQSFTLLLVIIILVFAYLIFILKKQKNRIFTQSIDLEKSNQNLQQSKNKLNETVNELEIEVENRKSLMISYYRHSNKKIQVQRVDGARPKIRVRDIVYIQKINPGHKSISYFLDSERIYTKSSFSISKLIDEGLSKYIFCRIGKYTIINLHEIKSFCEVKQEVYLRFMVFEKDHGILKGKENTKGKYIEEVITFIIEPEYENSFIEQIKVFKTVFE